MKVNSLIKKMRNTKRNRHPIATVIINIKGFIELSPSDFTNVKIKKSMPKLPPNNSRANMNPRICVVCTKARTNCKNAMNALPA